MNRRSRSLKKLLNRRREAANCSQNAPCPRCKADQKFLRGKKSPKNIGRGRAVRLVDLFCGCGGMTIGLHEAARRAGRKIEIALAIDSDPEVVELYKSNLPKANARAGEVDRIFDGHIGAEPTPAERLISLEVGAAPDILVGGPPCQGHSDLNNRTRRRDPKNALYLLMARAAEILKPKVVVIENVTGAQWDKDGVVQLTQDALTAAGYRVASRVLDLRMVGAPQRRRRFVMIGSSLEKLDPGALLDDVTSAWGEHSDRSVRWAIEDLLQSRRRLSF